MGRAVQGAGEPIDPAGWRARAREFADREVRPRVAEMERTDRMPEAIRAGLGREGFLGLTIPREFGGAAARSAEIVQVLSELGRASAAVATLLSVHLSVAAAPIVTWGTPGQKDEFLPRMARGEWLGAFGLTEPGVGSDAAHLATRYVAADGGYRLDGAKMFITNGGLADVVLTFATRDPAEGAKGTTAFLLPRGTPGFTVSKKLEKLGLRASETCELVLDGVRLPAGSRLGAEGQGITVALRALTEGRVGIAACALGVAEAALEELLAVGRKRPGDGVRSAAARAFTEVAAARALVEEAARARDAGAPFVLPASAAKLAASQAAVRTSQVAVELAGPDGALEAARPSQLLRDARVFPIVEGTTEIQELILGRALIGR